MLYKKVMWITYLILLAVLNTKAMLIFSPKSQSVCPISPRCHLTFFKSSPSAKWLFIKRQMSPVSAVSKRSPESSDVMGKHPCQGPVEVPGCSASSIAESFYSPETHFFYVLQNALFFSPFQLLTLFKTEKEW